MTKKVLVAFATQQGSTQGVAEFIGDTLQNQGAAVDVLAAKKVKNIDGYNAVIVGSGIMAGQLYGDATKFIKRFEHALGKIPAAYFIVCLTMKEDHKAHRQEVAAYLDSVKENFPQVQPVNVGLFAGVLDYNKLGFIKKMVMKKMEAPEGDFRDWEAISEWTRQLYPALSAG